MADDETQSGNDDQENPSSLTDVVDRLEDKAAEDGDLSTQDALDEFAGRLFGPLLIIPGLVTLTPLGGIPTLPTFMGLFIVLVAGQSLLGRKHPWLPGVIANRSVDEEKFKDSVEKFRPWMKWIDKFTAPRLTWMVKGPMKYGIAAVCIALACTLPPLEFLPFACAAPGAAILLLGLAITASDGLLAVVGIAGSAGAFYLMTAAWAKFAGFVGI